MFTFTFEGSHADVYRCVEGMSGKSAMDWLVVICLVWVDGVYASLPWGEGTLLNDLGTIETGEVTYSQSDVGLYTLLNIARLRLEAEKNKFYTSIHAMPTLQKTSSRPQQPRALPFPQAPASFLFSRRPPKDLGHTQKAHPRSSNRHKNTHKIHNQQHKRTRHKSWTENPIQHEMPS